MEHLDASAKLTVTLPSDANHSFITQETLDRQRFETWDLTGRLAGKFHGWKITESSIIIQMSLTIIQSRIKWVANLSVKMTQHKLHQDHYTPVSFKWLPPLA